MPRAAKFVNEHSGIIMLEYYPPTITGRLMRPDSHQSRFSGATMLTAGDTFPHEHSPQKKTGGGRYPLACSAAAEKIRRAALSTKNRLCRTQPGPLRAGRPGQIRRLPRD